LDGHSQNRREIDRRKADEETGQEGGKMKLLQVEGSWEKGWPVNWEFIGIVFIPEGEPPEFVSIDGVKYERRRTNE
jgi:hypothetical protein